MQAYGNSLFGYKVNPYDSLKRKPLEDAILLLKGSMGKIKHCPLDWNGTMLFGLQCFDVKPSYWNVSI